MSKKMFSESTSLVQLIGAVLVVIMMSHAALSQPEKSQGAGEWKQVENAMGRPGQVMGAAIRFGMPRKDLHVTVKGVAVKAGLALGSWAAFTRNGNNAVVMGDLVLTEDEVGPVMRKLQEGKVEISALHNHLLGEQPRVMYLHISSQGDAVEMAQVIHEAVGLTKTPAPDTGAAPATSESLGIDQKKMEEILGRGGKVNGGVLQFGVPRAETITEHGISIPPAMGVATALNFQSTGEGKAAITGDFVLIEKEVNPVMKALRDNGIEVTAVHSHMLMEEPRLFFMHFWANDDAAKLAKGLRAALDLTNSKKQ